MYVEIISYICIYEEENKSQTLFLSKYSNIYSGLFLVGESDIFKDKYHDEEEELPPWHMWQCLWMYHDK